MIRAAVGAWGARERADEIELVADELITNALMHTEGAAIVTLRVLTGSDRRLRVEVEDSLQRPAAPPGGGRVGGLGARPAAGGPARGRLGRGVAGQRQVRVVRVRGADRRAGTVTLSHWRSPRGGTLDACRNCPRSKRSGTS